MGSRARLGNGPAHRPRASSNSEPRSCDSACFLHSSRIAMRPYPFSFSSPLALSLFRTPATQRHPQLPYATRSATHSNRHHVAHASFAAAPSEHAATHVQNRRRLQHLSPRASASMPHILPSFPFALISPRLRLAVLSAPPSTHLAAVASQCALRTSSPLKIVTY